jgi:hypothetical protein
MGTAYCLESLGMPAVRQQRCERTARLMGWLEPGPSGAEPGE